MPQYLLRHSLLEPVCWRKEQITLCSSHYRLYPAFMTCSVFPSGDSLRSLLESKVQRHQQHGSHWHPLLPSPTVKCDNRRQGNDDVAGHCWQARLGLTIANTKARHLTAIVQPSPNQVFTTSTFYNALCQLGGSSRDSIVLVQLYSAAQIPCPFLGAFSGLLPHHMFSSKHSSFFYFQI